MIACRLLPFLLLLSLPGLAQTPPACANIASGSATKACTIYYGYSGSSVIYSCYAQSTETSRRPKISVSISAATNANPVVFTSTGHGFLLTARPQVVVSGATSGWTSINGTFTATIIDANTFSIPVNSTSFGALSGTVVFYTTAPRLGVAEWAVQLFGYSGSNLTNLTWLGGVNALTSACSSNASGNAQ